MKEEDFKKVIGKSTIETSDDFMDNLMQKVEEAQEINKPSIWWTFKPILIISTVLVSIITYTLFKLLNANDTIGLFTEIPKTPVFTAITLILLYYLNSMIKLNEHPTQ